ncbi:uncharacterized protein LOC123551743 isoform X2 [Mercenaria mercenaria]|uniref:uncharacterized protein LOC123551743 isoform X2 n=1 Tax=Mercenaria mercenaria TaxID=6596 RepID=UPI00234F6DB0|nr:uncharacterized protein LOC123551743 isoform X2 [Mercenaria mercenaria]
MENLERMIFVLLLFTCNELLAAYYPDGYKGCYVDKKDRILEVKLTDSQTNTGNNCKYRCTVSQYRYAGTEYAMQCFCGNKLKDFEKTPDSECDMICPGNADEYCGGSWRISIYDIGGMLENSIAIDADNFDCNFDDGLCNWIQDVDDDFDWTRLSGGTPNRNTGPKYDHTSGEGFYVFIDTSEAGKKDKARLISPQMDPGQYCFSLWYYMYGEHVDRLKVSVLTKEGKSELFKIHDSKDQRWILKQVQIDTQEIFKIVIEGKVKNDDNHTLGDIAIDDIVMFRSNRCPTDCDSPVPAFGLVDSQDFDIGSVVHIGCQSGYKLTGNPSIVCQANGSWSDRPVCNIVDCGKPTFNEGIIANTSEGTNFNMTIMLDCVEGFTLIGNAYVICKADGNWTTQPNCVINNCSDPTPESGNVNSTNNFEYGSVIEVTCIPGYKILGNSPITCLANSTWSDTPRCEQIDCETRTITNGQFNATFGTTFGKTATQSCDTGYSFAGDKTVTCSEAGWNGSIATCTIVDCSVPFLTNGILAETPNGTTYNKSAVLACVEGYTLSGNAYVTCQADGTWTVLPNCIVEDSEVSAVIAVYVTVPLIVIVLAIILTVYIWRKRHTQSVKGHDDQHETDMSPAIQFPNETYDKHALKNRSQARQSEADKLQSPDEEYATITDEQVEPTENVYYNTFDSECRIQKDTEHHYDHTKSTSKPVQDNTYSHMHGNNMDIEWKLCNDIKLIPNNSNASLRTEEHPENNYDHLDINNFNEAMKQEHSMTLNEEQESDYDHAKAGGIDPVPLDQDDYSHIRDGKVNQENTEKEMRIHDKYEYSNVTESTEKRDMKGNERKAEYEQPIGHTPQYFVLEAENENTPEDDRTYFMLEAEEKNDETYESHNHTYFVLEKTESA